MRSAFLLFLLLSALDARPSGDAASDVRWTRLGIRFEARPDIYRAATPQLLAASAEISEAITNLQAEHLAAVHPTFLRDHALVVRFEKRGATDAMFFPPRTFAPASEEWYITLSPGLLSSPTYLRTVAHEYFHAVHHALNPWEEDWIREGLAQLFEHLVFGGFNFAHVHAGLTTSDVALEEPFDPNRYRPEQYGNTLLYFYYVNAQCAPGNAFFWRLVAGRVPGRAGVTAALEGLAAPAPHCRSFAATAAAFSLAKLINGYSGFEQSPVTFLVNTDKRLSLDRARERQLLAAPAELWRRLAPWRPLRVSLPTALALAASAPPPIRWFGLERSYPNRVRELAPGDLTSLTNKWDVGFFRAD
jgi:hypothetical protein